MKDDVDVYDVMIVKLLMKDIAVELLMS